MQWYYYSRGQQVGPIDDDQMIRAVGEGLVEPTDYVWNTGMGAEWVQARTVPGLFAPPPLQPDVLSTPARASDAGLSADAGEPVAGSLGECTNRAWARTKDILFRPFNLGKWFALGFTAWLATLGEHGGGFNAGGNQWQETLAAESGGDPALFMASIWEKIVAHAPLIIGVVSVVIVISIVVGLVVLWIRCRGKFMFLDNVVHDRMEVANPWRAFRQHSNSLFLWSVVYTLIGLAVLAILVTVAVFSLLIPIVQQGALGALWPTLLANALLWGVMSCLFLYISRFLEDFVIPIMYRDNLSATVAWSRFLRLLGDHTWAFIGYGLYYLLLYLVAMLMVVALIVMTCCLAGCLLILPYVGTVVLLPMLVFFRCFSLEYLARFGAAFRLFPQPSMHNDQ